MTSSIHGRAHKCTCCIERANERKEARAPQIEWEGDDVSEEDAHYYFCPNWHCMGFGSGDCYGDADHVPEATP